MNPFDLKTLRKARRLNQTQLAELIGTEQARVSKIENDLDSISVGQFRKILGALGVSVEGELLHGWIPVHSSPPDCAIYIARHNAVKAIKIGKSIDTELRVQAFGDVRIEAEIRFATESLAINAERLLHRAFSAFRIPQLIAIELGIATDGATEWFKLECLDRLLVFVAQNEDLLGYGRRGVGAHRPLSGQRSKC